MKITFKKNGISKKVKYGISWTVFFFGWMALAIRGQYPAALISFFTFGLANFYYMFTANRILAHLLIEQGWVVDGELPKKWLVS